MHASPQRGGILSSLLNGTRRQVTQNYRILSTHEGGQRAAGVADTVDENWI